MHNLIPVDNKARPKENWGGVIIAFPNIRSAGPGPFDYETKEEKK